MEIKPATSLGSLSSDRTSNVYSLKEVSALTGMSIQFINRVFGRKFECLTEDMVVELLEQDAYAETFVPRSRILEYLRRTKDRQRPPQRAYSNELVCGDAVDLIETLEDGGIQCVATSTPYWAMRVYETNIERQWEDGEKCPFGMEQTPEGFIRHSIEILYRLKGKMAPTGSVWWNLMDTYNTRTQLRESASEILNSMNGNDRRKWSEHSFRRYSAGHSYLVDGEQCLIPQRIAERASRIGYAVKSIITWCKKNSLPEPKGRGRVGRNIEYILHLAPSSSPFFNIDALQNLSGKLGGRIDGEPEVLSDFWLMPSSQGRDSHGAQFPVQLPARCIALTTRINDLVLDPFIGSGTTAEAAALLGRRYVGFDVSKKYLETAKKRLEKQALLKEAVDINFFS